MRQAGSLLEFKRLLDNNCIITRDDVVSQRLKFGTAFLSSSWESKIALFFFLTFPYPVPVPKELCDFYWLQLRITCKSGWLDFIINVHFTRNLHNFVDDVTDA